MPDVSIQKRKSRVVFRIYKDAKASHNPYNDADCAYDSAFRLLFLHREILFKQIQNIGTFRKRYA